MLTRSARLGDGTQVVDEVVLGHANAAIPDVQDLVLLVEGDLDLKLGAITLAKLVLVGQRDEADLVKGITGVGDKLPQEDVLVRVQRVDDDVHQPVHLCLESELLGVGMGAPCLCRHALLLPAHVRDRSRLLKKSSV